MNRKGFAPIAIILFIVCIIAIGGIWYYATHKSISTSQIFFSNQSFSTPSNVSSTVVGTSSTETTSSAGPPFLAPYCYGDFPLGDSGPIFSPDKNYSASLYVDQDGAMQVGYALYVSDANSTTSIYLDTPPINTPGYHIGAGQSLYHVISSYSWVDNQNLTVTSYEVYMAWNDQADNGNFNRISPVEVWNYNVPSKTYSFVKNLPEPATPMTCLRD